MLRLTFEIKLSSNYHISAGYGKGFGVDSALLTEAGRYDIPVLRGSTLAGLLKDAARRLLQLPPLSKHIQKEERKKFERMALERLFGSPEQIKRWSISSAYPKNTIMEEKDIVQRIRLDPRTRRAKDKNLFTQEEGRAEQVFVFEAICRHRDGAAIDEASLIMAAARFVRQLGRSRRRGLGECTIHLKSISGMVGADKPENQPWEDYLLEHFNQAWLKNNLQEPVQTATKIDIESVPTPSEGAKVSLKLIIRLDEPLLISNRAAAGNWFDTRPVIPGTSIRGALASLAATRCNLADENDYQDFVMLFLREAINFPFLYPAYLLQEHIYPTIPSVMGLITCNIEPFSDSKGHGIYRAWESDKCVECNNEIMEAIDNFFVLKRVDDSSHTYAPSQSSEMHVSIDPKSQRAVKGELYGYNVLAAGQYFLGELNCADEPTWERFQEMTGMAEKKENTLRLGKARQRGYGKVSAWFERQAEGKPHVFIQTSIHDRVPNLEKNEAITLTLLTDTIITNCWGQQANGFTTEWLKHILDLGTPVIEYASVSSRKVDSFDTTLGLPRWRDTALAAGSMVRFYLTDLASDWRDKMESLETKGIGSRRNEGFGQIAFNHPAYELCDSISGSAIDITVRLPKYDRPKIYSGYELWVNSLPNKLIALKEIMKNESEKFISFFATLARWLYCNTDAKIEKLISQLEATEDLLELGQPQHSLIEAIGGKEEYGDRNVDNFFSTKTCENGIEKVCMALLSLAKLDQQYHKRGISHLADYIAGLTRIKEIGGQ